MTSSDLTALLAIFISVIALLLTFFRFRRERNKSNQDHIFQEKVSSYKKLMLQANKIFESFFDIVDDILDHDGSKKNWEKYFNEESEGYDELVTEFQEAIFESIPLLPAKVYKELIEFGQESREFVTTAFQGNTDSTINAHEKLEKTLRKVIGTIRDDLNVENLNVNLKNRLK